MTALPQSHLGCIAYTAYAVLAGTPIVAVGDRDGLRLLELIDRYRPTSVMAFGHCYPEIAAAAQLGSVDSVDVWVSMGDAVHQGHVAAVLALRDTTLPKARFLDRLGTTELGWGVLMKERTIDAVREDRCNGRATGSAEVAVLRENGSFADVDEIGRLGARGPAVTPGYWNNSTLTYEFKRGGYWLTGDLAYQDSIGNIYQVDRWVDVVDTKDGPGWSVWMEEVVLTDVPEIEDCAVVAGVRDNNTVAVCVARLADPAAADTEALLARINTALLAQNLVAVDTLTTPEDPAAIPLGVTGKVLKRELRNRLVDLDRLDPVYTRHLARRRSDTVA